MNPERAIETFIKDQLVRGNSKAPLHVDDSLIQSGIIDSMAILQLVAFIEDTFSVKVEDAEIDLRNFGTIRAMNELVRRKTSATKASGSASSLRKAKNSKTDKSVRSS